MKDLKILNLYSNKDDSVVDNFKNSMDSSLEVKHKFEDYKYDDEWIIKIEESLRYIENILKNPNRFIINEEEVVKIELARKITVESIKHLSKNTNFIQDIDEETGDVKPSKILNINKEESFNTYENRFIYSLIKSLGMFINKKKADVNTNFTNKNEKKISYNAKTKVGDENIDIAINFNSFTGDSDQGGKPINLEPIFERIKKIENNITVLIYSDLYQTLNKLNVAMVTSPIKKTNVILKNTNFQIAVNLWNYLQTHLDETSTTTTGDSETKDDPVLKEMVDEVFMMNYLVADSLDNKEEEKKRKDAASEYLVNNLVQKLVSTNSDLSKKELNDMIEKKFMFIKNQNLTNIKEIKKMFKIAIKKFRNDVKNNKLRSTYGKTKKNNKNTTKNT